MRRKALTILATGFVAYAGVAVAKAQVGAPGQPSAPVQIGAPGQPSAPVQVAPGRPGAPVQVGAPGQPGAPVQVAPGQPGAPGTERGQFDRDAGKRETIRGVIAGVTVMGEMTFDPATNRAQAAEASYLTIVGSPTNQASLMGRAGDNATTANTDQQGRSRHNIYALWVTPQTSIRDATSQTTTGNPVNAATPAAFDRIEIGDKVEVTYIRRENANSAGGDPRNEMRLRRHGRHRTYSGDVVSVTILATEPMRQNEATSETNAGARPNNRDDDRDKVRNNRNDEQPRNDDR